MVRYDKRLFAIIKKSKVSNFCKTTTIMKNGLLLASLLILLPIAVCSQTDVPVKFYSKAKMYVGEKSASDPSAVTMYIEGSAKFANNADTVASAQIVQKGVTKLTGDFVDAFTTKALDLSNTTTVSKVPDLLFDKNSFDTTDKPIGTIWFAGTDNVQRIYRDTIVYKQDALKYNYINFPNVKVNQTLSEGVDLASKGYVLVDTTAVISVANLQIGDGNIGGFAIDATYDAVDNKRMRSGYALIKDINNGAPETSEGWSRVNYKMWDNPSQNTQQVDRDGAVRNAQSLIPFASPFEQLAIDYTFYQVVFEPNGSDLSSGDGPHLEPDYIMTPGKGYLLAQEVSNFWYDSVYNKWNVEEDYRYQGKYEFSRKLFNYYSTTQNANKKPGYSQFGDNEIAEYFNTKDVTINLEYGFNFVGNPYMAPLSLKSLIVDESNPTAEFFDADFAYYGDANSAIKTPVRASVSSIEENGNRNLIHARYYVPHTGYIYYKAPENEWAGHWYYYGMKYYASQKQGDTNALKYLENTHTIAPMGVFGLSAGEAMQITLKRPTEDVLVDNNIAFSPKSVGAQRGPNELLIQAIDNNYDTEDRLCLVFTDKGIAEEPALMNVRKTISKAYDEDGQFELPTGLIYTKSIRSGEAMLTNFVSEDIEQMAMYIVPPTAGKARNITLKPYRMETLDRILNVWVEDRLDGSIKELTEDGLDYTIPVSAAATSTDNLDYRFILHFKEPKGGGVDPINPGENKGLLVYYNTSTLYIKNLLDIDTNSVVEIYDMQGRLISKFKISQEDVLNQEKLYSRSLAQGAYIVKITGKRNYTTKFVSF